MKNTQSMEGSIPGFPGIGLPNPDAILEGICGVFHSRFSRFTGNTPAWTKVLTSYLRALGESQGLQTIWPVANDRRLLSWRTSDGNEVAAFGWHWNARGELTLLRKLLERTAQFKVYLTDMTALEGKNEQLTKRILCAIAERTGHAPSTVLAIVASAGKRGAESVACFRTVKVGQGTRGIARSKQVGT